jgi:hypothetical protein
MNNDNFLKSLVYLKSSLIYVYIYIYIWGTLRSRHGTFVIKFVCFVVNVVSVLINMCLLL